jgi:hypothetical protein
MEEAMHKTQRSVKPPMTMPAQAIVPPLKLCLRALVKPMAPNTSASIEERKLNGKQTMLVRGSGIQPEQNVRIVRMPKIRLATACEFAG